MRWRGQTSSPREHSLPTKIQDCHSFSPSSPCLSFLTVYMPPSLLPLSLFLSFSPHPSFSPPPLLSSSPPLLPLFSFPPPSLLPSTKHHAARFRCIILFQPSQTYFWPALCLDFSAPLPSCVQSSLSGRIHSSIHVSVHHPLRGHVHSQAHILK